MEKKTVPDLALPLGGGARSPFESSDSAALAGYVSEQQYFEVERERLRFKKALEEIKASCLDYRESDFQYAIYETADAALNET